MHICKTHFFSIDLVAIGQAGSKHVTHMRKEEKPMLVWFNHRWCHSLLKHIQKLGPELCRTWGTVPDKTTQDIQT